MKFYVPGEVDLPRVLLVSVPYALKAGDADTLGGRPASAYLLAGPSMLVVPEVPSQPVAVASVTTTADVTPSISSGSPGYIAKFTNTTDVVDSVMYQNNTSIGINTTTPLDVLHVAGNITTEVDGGPSSGPTLDLRNTPPTGFGIGSIDFYTYPGQTVPSARWRSADIGGFTADQTLYTSVGGGRNAPLMPRLTVKGATGYVGIGTTSPVAPLEIKGNAQVDGNLTLSGSILSPGGVGPIIQAPNNGSGNFSAGLGALSVTTTGISDTAVGYAALQDNTTGNGNTATGFEALLSNTTGSGNTAYGYQALGGNATASYNTATGSGTLAINAGPFNTADGYQALGGNTMGNFNTASGASALTSNTTGSGNTASGSGALEGNATGSHNTANGVAARCSSTPAEATTSPSDMTQDTTSPPATT